MPCYHPNRAFQLPNGKITFGTVRPSSRALALELPCGQCIGCRLERTRQWAIRITHEARCYDFNQFVTLTYNDEHLPQNLSLNKRHYVLFMKRLRKRFRSSDENPIRFFMCGEYGEARGRPHYHACLFNIRFPDERLYSERGGNKLYTSEILDATWQLGECKIGALTFESAAYVASYCTQRITGELADKTYRVYDSETGETWLREPEYAEMSRDPGIGAPWLDRYLADAYPSGQVLTRGNRFGKPPRYYDDRFRKLYDNNDAVYNIIKNKRKERAILNSADNTRARRDVKEKVAELNFQRKTKRSLK